MIILPSKRIIQPQVTANLEPEFSNATIVWTGNSYERDAVTGKPFTITGSGVSRSVYTPGMGASFTFTSSYINLGKTTDQCFPNLSAGTIVLYRRRLDLTNRGCFAFVGDTNPNIRVLASLPFSDGTIYFDFGDASGNRLAIAGVTFTTSPECFVFTAGARGLEVWRDGINLGSGTMAGARTGSSNPFYIGAGPDLGSDVSEDYLFATFPTEFSKNQCKTISKNPWGIFAPTQKRRIFTFKPAGGSQTLSLTCAAGAYAYSGQTATLTHARTLTCAAGAYTYTGQAATLTHARTLTCAAGAYAYSGQVATLQRTHTLTCAAGSYAYAGQTAALTHARTLTCAAGAYSYAGQTATLQRTHALTCAAGAYTYAGQSATLTKTGINNYALTCVSGSYTYSGQTATLTHARSLTCAAGAYTYTGMAAILAHSRSLTCASGSYAYTGQAATLTAVTAQTLTLTCASGSYAYTGQNISFSGTVTQRQGNSGGYFDIYTGRKREKLPPRVLKKKLEKEKKKKEEILEIVDENPGKLKFYAKDLREIQVKIDALKEQIEGRYVEAQQQDNQQQYHQSKRYEMIVRMLLLS